MMNMATVTCHSLNLGYGMNLTTRCPSEEVRSARVLPRWRFRFFLHYLILPWIVWGLGGACGSDSLAAEKGHQPQVSVQGETRIDWVFALANQSPAAPPANWLPEYDSTQQTYELFVPSNYDPARSWPVVLFISPSKQSAGFAQWKAVCEQEGILFASPHGAGNDCDTRRRVRIVLDVLDDVRQRYNVDPDRTYIGGFSGGGRIACAIAFSLPEYFGGAIPVCAAGDLREESWLRQRVTDRVSVAHLTGATDFNRGEVERFRGPMLADVGVRSKVWVVPGLGHGIPDATSLRTAYRWLEEGMKDRQKLAEAFPASRISTMQPAARQDLAQSLAAEAKKRMVTPKTNFSGLMQFKGILQRWPDLPEAETAKTVLLEVEQANDKSWEAEDIAERRKFLVARARRLSDYALGPLPSQYEGQRKPMVEAALQLWDVVVEDGQDASAVADAKLVVPKLKEIQAK